MSRMTTQWIKMLTPHFIVFKRKGNLRIEDIHKAFIVNILLNVVEDEDTKKKQPVHERVLTVDCTASLLFGFSFSRLPFRLQFAILVEFGIL